MNEVRPIFKILLIIALAIYIIGNCAIQADLYARYSRIKHAMVHILKGNIDVLTHK